jgi:hypothetical protein
MARSWRDFFPRKKAQPSEPQVEPAPQLVFKEPEARLIAETAAENLRTKRKIGRKITPWVELDYLDPDQALLETGYRQMVNKGTITARELFALDYNGLPVPQNQMSEYHNLDKKFPIGWVKFDDDDKGTSGAVLSSGEIAINENVRYERPLQGTVGHEVIHKLSHLARVTEPQPNTLFLARGTVDGHFGPEMGRAVTRMATEGNGTGLNRNQEEGIKNYVAHTRLGYFYSHEELLPRIHQVLVNVYHKTGHIPQSRLELYAAFQSAEFTPPDSILLQLRQAAERPEIRRFAARETLVEYETTRELRRLVNLLPEAAQCEFWENVLPAYTGDLLNLYGHCNGRALMGVPTPDPEGARAFLAAFRDSTGKETPQYWNKLASRVRPEYAAQLLQRVIEQELGEETKPKPKYWEPARALITRQNNAVRDKKNWPGQSPVKWMASRSDLKLLDFALGNGFDANEWLHHEDRTRCVSILAAVVSSAVDAESTKARKHLVKIARVLMKHGADPDKLPHACAVEAPEDKRSLNQWAREEHGAANLNEYLDKLEKRPVAARRASLSIGLEELFGIAAQGVKVTELPGIRIVIVGRRR